MTVALSAALARAERVPASAATASSAGTDEGGGGMTFAGCLDAAAALAEARPGTAGRIMNAAARLPRMAEAAPAAPATIEPASLVASQPALVPADTAPQPEGGTTRTTDGQESTENKDSPAPPVLAPLLLAAPSLPAPPQATAPPAAAPAGTGTPPATAPIGPAHGRTAPTPKTAAEAGAPVPAADPPRDALPAVAPPAPDAAPAATAPPATLPSGVPARAIPPEAVPMTIASLAREGGRSFDIRLDPAELGRIEVKLSIDHDGTIRTHIVVERPDTLSLLRNDSQKLDQAFASAGLAADTPSFSLQDQPGHGRPAPHAPDAPGGAGEAGDARPEMPIPIRRAASAASRIDLVI